MTDVLIHSPFPRQDSQGNSATADRLKNLLQGEGLSVQMEEEWFSGCEARCLVALNARRSVGAVEEFRDAYPDGRVVIVLTGTDINHPDARDENSETYRSMRDADALVVLHEASLGSVPSAFHPKCQIIYPSVFLPSGVIREPRDDGVFEVVMAGNVRAEKNLPVVVDACRLLPEDLNVVVRVYGDAEGELAQMLMAATASPLPFQWKGKLSHRDMMDRLAQADLLLNSSTQEGGANAVCEAVSMGLPVLASRISGNMGMLGDDYLGYFGSDDARELADQLLRCATVFPFYKRLGEAVEQRAPLFLTEVESQRWSALIRELDAEKRQDE